MLDQPTLKRMIHGGVSRSKRHPSMNLAASLRSSPKFPHGLQQQSRSLDSSLRSSLGMTRIISDDSLHPGSNNWVVSGAHTASGKPLLSNDMHLDLQIPNVWYEAHLTAGDFDVAGVTLPGVPFVIVGHNRYIAWGFTNLGPNVEDLYVEKFNDKGEYLTPQGWVQPEHRKEIIRVKGRPEVNVDVEITRHGPIITDLIPGEQRKLALKWIIYDPQASGTLRSLPWTRRRTGRSSARRSRSSARRARTSSTPMWMGTSATRRPGMIPIRAAGDGSVPVPGEDDCARVDRIRSLRQASQRVRSAVGNHRHRQRPHHARRISLHAEHRVGIALSHRAHLQAAEGEQEAHAARHAGHPDRHCFGVRSLLRRALRLRRRSHRRRHRSAPKPPPT